MDNIKIMFIRDNYSEQFTIDELDANTIISNLKVNKDFNYCALYVLNMFNSVKFQKNKDNTYTLEFIKNSIVKLSESIEFGVVQEFIINFINYIIENSNKSLLLKLCLLGSSEKKYQMMLKNLMIIKKTKTDKKELEILLHTSQKFDDNQYFYFFVEKRLEKIVFCCEFCTEVSYSIFTKNHLDLYSNNLKCVNFDFRNTRINADKAIDFKPFYWTYNIITIKTNEIESNLFETLFLENKISNYYGETKSHLPKSVIIGDQNNEGNKKLITTPPKCKDGKTDRESFMWDPIDYKHFKGYRVIYAYVDEVIGKVKIVRKCWDKKDGSDIYLSKYKTEYDVQKGHNCFIFESKISDDPVYREDVGLSVFSIQEEDITSSCQISNAIVFNVYNSFICTNEKVENILGGLNDEPNNKKDLLNYEKYSRVLSDLILNNSIQPPITFGIYSEWGTGKSFLLNQIRKIIKFREYEDIKKNRKCCCFNYCFNCKENFIINTNKDDKYELKEEGPTFKNCYKLFIPCCNALNYCRKTRDKNYIFIEFNAWEYSGSDVLWAGLVKCMYDKLEEEFGTIIFRLTIYYYSSFNFCNFLWQLLKYITIVGIGIIISYNLNDSIASLVSLLSGICISVLTILPGLKDFVFNIYKGESKLLEEKINKINNKVGFMAVVKEKIEMLSKILKKFNCQPIIFIDDIDRCTHDKAVQVLNAVKLLLSGSSNFYTFLAIDPRLVVKAIESSYKETIVKAGITGYDFIDKIVQIPFVLPKQSISSKQLFVEGILKGINQNIKEKNNKLYGFSIEEKEEEKISNEEEKEKISNEEEEKISDEEKENKIQFQKIMDNEVIQETKILGNFTSDVRPIFTPQMEFIINGTTTFGEDYEMTKDEDENEMTKDENDVEYEESSDDEEKNKINENQDNLNIEPKEKPFVLNKDLIDIEEINIFYKYAKFLDSNGRRLVRIINVYILSRKIYNDDNKNIHIITDIFEKIIFSIILSEQWAYRTSFLLLFLDIKFRSTPTFENDFSDKTIKDVYNNNIKKYIFKNDNLINLSFNDSRDDIFDSFINEFEEFNVIEFYFTNEKYIFNLNPAISEEILREIHKEDLKGFV